MKEGRVLARFLWNPTPSYNNSSSFIPSIPVRQRKLQSPYWVQSSQFTCKEDAILEKTKTGQQETKHRKYENNTLQRFLTHCGGVTQICVFNTVKLGTSASSTQCHSTSGNVSRGITPSSATRVFGEYFLKISVHKNSQRICYTFLKKHSIKVD